jgi:hypothetical protein
MSSYSILHTRSMSITSLNTDLLTLIIDLIPREFNRSSLQYSCRYIYRCWNIWSLKTQKQLLLEVGLKQNILPRNPILIRNYIEDRIFEYQCIEHNQTVYYFHHLKGDNTIYI